MALHIRHLKPKNLVLTTLVAALIGAGGWFYQQRSSSAADLSKFDPGNIMSDAVMSNKNSMTEAQIQAFLNSKNPCNNTNTHMAAWYPNLQYNIKDGIFVCMAKESFNGESAARIIWQAGQDYNINPQVLIVLLQKEQGLITDTWPNHVQYRTATGYGCPDTAPCDEQYYGLKNQVRLAAAMFRTVLNGGWSNYPVGNNYVLYNPNHSCGGTNINIKNRATSALYRYTPYQPNQSALNAGYGTGDSCGAYGNRNFWLYFTDWFGTTTSTGIQQCDVKAKDATCVYSARKTDGSQFLTISKNEFELAINRYGWADEGIAFYASHAKTDNTIPVYRLQHNNRYYYSADQSEYNTLKHSNAWADEGIAFYAPSSAISNNTIHKIYKLYNASQNHHYWTRSTQQKDTLLRNGYSVEQSSFNSISSTVSIPTTPPDRNNVYRLYNGSSYLYTANLSELESAVKMGFQYVGTLTTANTDTSGIAIHRLQNSVGYLYTANNYEKDVAVSKYGYVYEGIVFYLDDASNHIYRLANTSNNSYLYTSNISEAMSLVNTYSWRFEDSLVRKDNEVRPVYRFLNIYNNRHFYTANLDEAMKITNKGWKYETVAFSVHWSSGLPVHRLRFQDKHFYTTSSQEKDKAVSNYGYVYEGIVFYVSDTSTERPAFRLQGGSDEYFFTASSAERDSAINKYGYKYEGIGFYLP